MLLESPSGQPSFLPLPTALLEQMMTCSAISEPGVTTLRVPDSQESPSHGRDQFVRETDFEVCFVCKKCRAAFSSESNLLTHQRQCFGGNLDNRGAFRLVQTGVECMICPGERFQSVADYRNKHIQSEVHLNRALQHHMSQQLAQQQFTQQLAQQQFNQQQGQQQLQLPPPSESPLSHEMEDVVNQITLLAARAAQEAGSGGGTASPVVDSNSNQFCPPGEPKRRFLNPGEVAVQPLTSAGH